MNIISFLPFLRRNRRPSLEFSPRFISSFDRRQYILPSITVFITTSSHQVSLLRRSVDVIIPKQHSTEAPVLFLLSALAFNAASYGLCRSIVH